MIQQIASVSQFIKQDLQNCRACQIRGNYWVDLGLELVCFAPIGTAYSHFPTLDLIEQPGLNNWRKKVS